MPDRRQSISFAEQTPKPPWQARISAISRSDPTTASLTYRPEIDGLRALAVLGVILCHGGFTWIPGGFLGVDLFFVVSGYLITAILRAELAEGRFSILRFYERRIRRILPALMLVLLLSILPALWMLLPDNLDDFGQSLVATTLFANNLLLLSSTGYFGIDVQLKPLMHTWSLGVEEQYYLLVPLLMLVAWRIGKGRAVLLGVAAVTALSLLAWLWYSRVDPLTGFFLIVSRGWELGAGSLVALTEARIRPLARPRTAAGLALAGLAMAVAPLFLVTTTASPGLKAVVPVAGICLILFFGGTRDPAGRLLTLRPMIWLGLVSYSAYLFHQPVFAFARIASAEPPSQWLMAALLLPILAAAWASWRFVEQPFRDRTRTSTRTVLLATGGASLAVIAIGLAIHLTGGFYRAWPPFADPRVAGRSATIAYNMAPARFVARALPDAPGKPRVLVIGDSFGRDFINMALANAALDEARISLTMLGPCAPLPPATVDNIRRADFIVLASRFQPAMVACVVARVEALRRQSSARIIVMGRKSFGSNNNVLIRVRDLGAARVRPLADAVTANEAAKRALPPEIYVDALAMLGDPDGRLPVFTPDGQLISQDHEHFTQPGARDAGAVLFRHPALAALREAAQ